MRKYTLTCFVNNIVIIKIDMRWYLVKKKENEKVAFKIELLYYYWSKYVYYKFDISIINP